MEFLDAHPLLLAPAIFLARVADVSLGTFRTIIVFRGHRWLAAGIGFVEVMIWVTAAGQVFNNLQSWYLTVAYAGGFACGNYVGMFLESHVAIGRELVRAISFSGKGHLAERLREQGYRVVELSGSSGEQPAEVVLVIERRREVPLLIATIEREDPQAIYTVSDVKSVHNPEWLSAEQPLFDGGWRVGSKRK